MAEQERRRQEREYPRRLTLRLRVDDRVEEYRLLNESESGLGLFAVSAPSLHAGLDVEIELEPDQWQSGIVQYLRPLEHGGFQVGVRWREASDGKFTK
jgi:hypothetical protein